jgi:hypothetical protein
MASEELLRAVSGAFLGTSMASIPASTGSSEAQSSTKPDVHSIMERVRSLVAEQLATPRAAFKPSAAPFHETESSTVPGELLHSSELRLINQRHAFSLDINPDRIPNSHRSGLLGKIITIFKRKLLVFLRDAILSDYLRAEHEFQSAVTNYLNALTRYIDQRDGADFTRLVHKIDVDTGKGLERIDRIADEVHGSLETLRAEMEKLQVTRPSHPAAVQSNLLNPIPISPAMTPSMVSLVEKVNDLALRVAALSARDNG